MCAFGQKAPEVGNPEVVLVGLKNVIGTHPVYRNEEQRGFGVRRGSVLRGNGGQERKCRN